MQKEDLLKLKQKLSKLNDRKLELRDLYLRKLSTGEIQGPSIGHPSIDKPWLRYYDDEKIKMKLPKKTAYRYLYDENINYRNRIALSYFGQKITFENLFWNIEKTARSLKAMGVEENDIISVSLPNIPEAVYVFYAISKIGAIANMIDPRTSSEGIKDYVKEVNSKMLIMIDSYYDKVESFTLDGTLKKIVAVSPVASLPLGIQLAYKSKEFIENMKMKKKKTPMNKNTMDWNQFMEKGKEYQGQTEASYVANRPLVIEHTGGTTGKPKGVLLSNENINAVAFQSILTGIDMKREHNWLDIMPTFIAYGVGQGLHLPLVIGMETILIPQFDAKKFDELLVKYEPIHMVGVPSYWETIIKSKKLAKKDLSYIIAPTVGGDAMVKSLEVNANDFLAEHHCTSKITKGYGMTELTGGVAGTIDENNEIGSVGIPFVQTTISVFDPVTGEELGYHEEGEICVTGPNVMLEYYKNKGETEAVLKMHADGKIWVHSKDLGYMNERGSIFITDRLKRIYPRYDGFKIQPSQIEAVVMTHPGVESCCVVGIDDIEHCQGKLPKVHFVLKTKVGESKQVLEQIKEICQKQLPEYLQPVEYQERKEMPLTSIGKIDYRALEEEDRIVKQYKSYIKK